MPRAFIIRPVERRDRDDIIANYYSFVKELKTNPSLGLSSYKKTQTLKQEREWFKKMYSEVRRGNAIASVAEVDGRVVGLCNVQRKGGRVETSHIGILGIAIINGYRGIGIGKSLLKDVIKRSRKHFEMIELSVFKINKGAEKLYRKVGFVEFGTLPGGIKREGRYIDETMMFINLRKS